MLVDFKIINYALIDELEITFKEGLNILTGETGAGKSIIIGALEIMLGARASSDLIRTRKESAYIEAAFAPKRLKEINQYLEYVGIETDANLLILSREIRRNGNNRNRINGQLATAGMIKNVSQFLVDIHGQHEHQSLLEPGFHLILLDDFVGQEAKNLKKEVNGLYQEINEIKRRLSEIQIDESEKARQIDLLEFQIDEIEKARLQKNEIEELHNEYRLLTNMEEIYSISGMISNGISGDDYSSQGLLGELGSFIKELDSIKELSPDLNNIYSGLKDAFYQLEDLGSQIHEYHDKLEYDQERLEKIEDRLKMITGLQRKYGQTIEEIIAYQNRMQEKLNNLKSQEKLVKDLEKELKIRTDDYSRLAGKLSLLRQERAGDLEQKIIAGLQELAMIKVNFKVAFEKKPLSEDGIDQIEFLISTNPGETLKPLQKIASGGELSRIMLVLKTIIAHTDQVDTLIFDEVDNGVGGQTAQKMAEKLALISRQRQVICISHLPQIASMADYHLLISKKTEEDYTCTVIEPLNQEGQKKELARMLGGVKLTETTLQHAEEMLNLARKKKSSLR